MKTYRKRITAALLATLTALGAATTAFAATPGSSIIDMKTVKITGGNAADGSAYGHSNANQVGYGAVPYDYYIGTYEVTNAQYAQFLNAVAKQSDTYALYNTDMASRGLTRSGSAGNWTYTATDPNKPVAYVNFWDAARFCNWLTSGDTETGVYNLGGVKNPTNNTVSRNADAWAAGGWALPTENEWYKAAYYNPTTDSYSLYGTGKNTISTSEANYASGMSWVFKDVGSYLANPNGAFDMAGNTWERNETIVSTTNRGQRGGTAGNSDTNYLASSYRNSISPATDVSDIGFRVAVSSLTPPPVIGSFTVETPATPTAAINAVSPTGTAPLDSTVTWTTSNAATVSVSGPDLDLPDAEAIGYRPVTLPAGTHTYTVTAQPQTSATISWTTTDATNLTLETPSGDVDVTGQTSYTATESGTYILKASNTPDDVVSSAPLTVTLPDVASDSITIMVEQPLPTIPPEIDDDSVVVIPDPTTPGGIVIDGGIGGDPDNPEQAQELEEEKIFLVTTTNILGTWNAADRSSYTVTVAPDGKSFTLAIDPTSDTARFYRVATSLQPVDISGAPGADDTIKYNTVLFGSYKVTVPANGAALVGNLLDNGGSNLVTSLFAGVRGNTNINVQQPDGSFAFVRKAAIGNSWTGTTNIELPMGYAAHVTNGGAATTLTFTGIVPTEARSYDLRNGVKTLLASTLPVEATNPVEIGYTRTANELFNWYDAGGVPVMGSVPALGSGWTGTQPAFAIGQGFYLTPKNNRTWVQPGVTVSPDNLAITR